MEKSKEILIGFIAGIICGLFASGGGLILVPAFIHILKKEDRVSRGTATLCVLPLVITSGIFYYKENYIDWKLGLLCAVGGTLGGIVGAKLLNKISTRKVKILFVIFLIYTSIKMLF